MYSYQNTLNLTSTYFRWTKRVKFKYLLLRVICPEFNNNKFSGSGEKYLSGFLWRGRILHSSFDLTGWDPGVVAEWQQARVKADYTFGFEQICKLVNFSMKRNVASRDAHVSTQGYVTSKKRLSTQHQPVWKIPPVEQHLLISFHHWAHPLFCTRIGKIQEENTSVWKLC